MHIDEMAWQEEALVHTRAGHPETTQEIIRERTTSELSVYRRDLVRALEATVDELVRRIDPDDNEEEGGSFGEDMLDATIERRDEEAFYGRGFDE